MRGVRNDCTTLSSTSWVHLGRLTLPTVIFVLSLRRSNWLVFGLHFLLSSWSWPCRSQTTRSGWLFARRSFSLRARRPLFLPRALTAWPLLFSGPREVASQLPGPSACFLGWPLRLGVVITAPAPPRGRRDSNHLSPVRPSKPPQLVYSCPLGLDKCPLCFLGRLCYWGKSVGALSVFWVGAARPREKLQPFVPTRPFSSTLGALLTSGRAPHDCWLWSCGGSASSQAALASAWWSPPQHPPG